jgi:protein O-mannosyl-transferase
MSRKLKKHPPQRPKTPDGARRAVIGVCVFLFLAVLLVFGRSVWFEFVDFDDTGNVSENPFVKQGLAPASILWALTHSQVGDWIPLTTLSHMLDCQVFGLWAGGHHLTNVLLHAVTSVLLFLVLRDLTGSLWRSAGVAALFALHPLRAESVAWITERKDLLSALFFVLTLGAYARWTRAPARSRGWILLFLALGLLSKTMLVTTPLVLLLLDHWPLRRTADIRFSRLVFEKIPLFLLSAAAAVGQLLAARPGIGSVESYPIARRAANAVVSCATYVFQMFWPANLAGFYPYPRHGVDGLLLAVSAAGVLGISVAAYYWRRRAPWLAVGWLWYLLMLIPVLGLVQAGEVSRADRYTYLPQIGLYLMIAWTVGAWCTGQQQRRVLAGTAAVLVLATLALLAFRQTGFWKDSATLWNRALACTSDNDTAHYNLGTGLLQKGRLDEAIVHYQKTLEANPAYADAHINLGRALLQKGLPDEAIAHYRKALDIKPRYAEAHYNLGIALVQKERLDEAIAHYRQAIEINPAYADAQNNLGSALLRAGKPDEAIPPFEAALQSDPGNAKAHNNLAAALVQKGRIADAVAHYEKVLQIDPDHVKACNSLAWLLATSPEAAVRNGVRAVQLAERADQLTGGKNPLMLRTLAAARAESGRFDDAIQAAQRALDLAAAQGNEELVRALRDQIEHYKAGQPLR